MTELEALRKLLREHPHLGAKLIELHGAGKLQAMNEAQQIELPNPIVVVCGSDPGGIVGAKQDRCGCGAIVWVSPSTQELQARRTAPTFFQCGSCVLAQVKARTL